MRVAYFPYQPGGNPYQSLFASALEQAGNTVLRIPPLKLFPLRRAAAAHDFDVLQLDWPHDWYRGRNALLQWGKRQMYLDGLRKIKNVPVVWTAHNLVAHDAPDPHYEMQMIQQLVDASNGIIVMSDASRELLEQTYIVASDKQVRVIPHGHYIDCYPNAISKHDARSMLGITGDARVALFFGRLLPYKGIEDLIDNFAAVSQPGSVLLIAGSCSNAAYAQQLQALAAKACQHNPAKNIQVIVHAQFIGDDQLQHYFNAADFVVLPFKNILNSGSLMLAMSFGKHVVAPALGSIASVVPEFGWSKYTADDPGGLGGALLDAFAMNDFAQHEKNILDYTKENYSWDTIGRQVSELYRALL